MNTKISFFSVHFGNCQCNTEYLTKPSFKVWSVVFGLIANALASMITRWGCLWSWHNCERRKWVDVKVTNAGGYNWNYAAGLWCAHHVFPGLCSTPAKLKHHGAVLYSLGDFPIDGISIKIYFKTCTGELFWRKSLESFVYFLNIGVNWFASFHLNVK